MNEDFVDFFGHGTPGSQLLGMFHPLFYVIGIVFWAVWFPFAWLLHRVVLRDRWWNASLHEIDVRDRRVPRSPSCRCRACRQFHPL